MKVGYVRVSTVEQNTARQEEIMERYGVERTFSDKQSGKDMDRPELKKMMEFVRDEDCVIVESISRFARTTKDLLELVDTLDKKGVQFISEKEKLDTETSTGRFMLTIFAAVAELERENIRQRQSEGIAIAKAEGRFNGRPRKEVEAFGEVYTAWKGNKLTASEAAKQCKMARSTFYRRVKEYEEEQEIDF